MPDIPLDSDDFDDEEDIPTADIAEIEDDDDNNDEEVTVKKKKVVVDVDDEDEDHLPSPTKPSLDLIFVEKFWKSRKKEFISKIFPQFFVPALFIKKVFNENDMQEYRQWCTVLGNIDDPDERRRIYKDLGEKIWKMLLKKIQKDPDRIVEIIQVLRVDDWYNEMADDWKLHIDDESKKQRQQQLEHDEYLRQQNVGLLPPAYGGGGIPLKDRPKLKMINFPEPIAKHIDREPKRKEIVNYLKKFAKQGKGWLILYGIHGSGKTVLAESSVRRLKPELYEHGIFWIQIGDLSSTEEMFDQTLYLKMEILYDSIRFLHGGLESKSDKLEKIKADLKRHFLLKPKSLLILDDVRSKHTLKHFNFGVPVLVTTIDRSVACNMDNIDYNFVSITIDGTDTILNKDESYDLLLKHLPRGMHQNYLKNSRYLPNILETVNGIPYYIPLIANYMMPFADSLGIFNQKRSDNLDSTIWKELSEMLHDNLCNKLLMETIDEIKKREPELVEYLYDFSIFMDPIPQSVLNVLWGKKFDKHPRINMGQIVQQLINKSLLKVHCGVRKSNAFVENKLYSIHDLTACFLMEQLGPEKQKERHSILIDSFEAYLKNDANVLVNGDDDDEEREQIKNYIHHCLSLHIYSSGRYDLFPKYFLDLNFLKEKIRYVGQSHILVEFENFRNCFNGWQKHTEDMHRFIASSADISEPSEIDLFQLALCQPNDSFVYSEAIKKLDKNQGFYFEWCNKDNYALENQLVKLRFKCKDNTKYASLSPSSNYIATINNCDLNLYDGKTGNLVKCQKRHNKTINHCTFSRNGEYILTTADDGKAILWRSPLTTIITAAPPPSTTAASVEPLRKRTSSYNSALQPFKEFMSMPSKMKADSSTMDVVVNKYKCGDLSSKNTWALLGTTTGFIHLYSVERSQLIAKLPNPNHLEYEVETCCFAPNDSCFIFSMSHFVFVYKLDSDENNNNNDSVKAVTLLYTLKHDEKVYNAVFNPRPKSRSHPIDIFTSSGKQVCQWKLKHHSIMTLLRGQKKEKPRSKYVLPQDVPGLISFCAVSPTGDAVAGFECSRHEIYIWNVQKKSMQAAVSHCIPLHTLSNIHTMSFSSDGGRLLSLNSKNEITFWDIKEFDAVSSVVDLKDDFAAAINEKSSMLNVLTIDKKGFVRLFEGKTGIENQNFKTSLKEKLSEFCGGDRPNPIRFNIVCCDISPKGYSIFCTEYGDVFFFCNFETTLLNHQQPDSEKILKCKFLPNRSNNDDDDRDKNRDPISKCSHHNSAARFVTMTQKQLCFYQAYCDLRIQQIGVIQTKPDIILESFWFVSPKILMFWTRNNICHFCDCDRIEVIQTTPRLESTITSVHSCKMDDGYLIAITLADKALVLVNCDSDIQDLSLIGQPRCGGETPRCCQICPNYVVYGCDSGKICLIKPLHIHAYDGGSTDAVIEWTRQHSNETYVNYLAISMDEKYIVSAADSIKLWNSHDGRLLQTFISHGDISRLFVHFSGAPTSTSTAVGNHGGHHHHGHKQNGQDKADHDHGDDQEAEADDEEEEEPDSIEDDERMDQIDGQTSSTMKDIQVIIVAITQAKSLYILENYQR